MWTVRPRLGLWFPASFVGERPKDKPNLRVRAPADFALATARGKADTTVRFAEEEAMSLDLGNLSEAGARDLARRINTYREANGIASRAVVVAEKIGCDYANQKSQTIFCVRSDLVVDYGARRHDLEIYMTNNGGPLYATQTESDCGNPACRYHGCFGGCHTHGLRPATPTQPAGREFSRTLDELPRQYSARRRNGADRRSS